MTKGKNRDEKVDKDELKPLEVRKGINYLADCMEKAKDIFSMIVSHFGGTPAWIVTSYAIHRLETNAKLSKNYEELLGIETNRMSHFFKPEFLRGYKFTFGGAKKGGLSYFDEMGNITNFSGTLYDIFSYAFEVAPEFVEDTISQYIPMPEMPKVEHIPEYIPDLTKEYIQNVAGHYIQNMAKRGAELRFGDFVNKLKYEYTRLELTTVRGTGELLHFTERQDEIKERGSKKELGSGGWVVHPMIRERLTGERRGGTPLITFMVTKDAEIQVEDKTIKLKKETPISKDEVEAIADSGKSLPWGIAKVKESGKFDEWLVEPKLYDKTITYVDRSGKRIREESPAFEVAGILWLFDFDEGMFVGGDKAPGSSVAAPLNPLFTDLLLQKDENKNKFNKAVGEEAKKFVAALEIHFKDRKKTEIPWYEGYNYPIFFPTRESQEKFQKYFIGVHRIDHVKEIIVKDVFSL